MSSTPARRFKAVFTVAISLMLSVSAFSQITLRKAMDTDGDNKADFTIFRPNGNLWYINKSGGGFTVTNFGVASTDFMTPGDYDGDGRGDIAVWRDTTGFWY